VIKEDGRFLSVQCMDRNLALSKLDHQRVLDVFEKQEKMTTTRLSPHSFACTNVKKSLSDRKYILKPKYPIKLSELFERAK
jgi:hypothetical protein